MGSSHDQGTRPLPGRRLSAFVLATGLIVAGCTSDNANTTVTETPTAVIEAPAGAATVAPTPTTTPGVALTPRAPASTDLSTAQRLESEGDLQAAADAYVTIAARNNADKPTATLNAARLLLELDQPADVRVLLEPFVPNTTGRDAASHYLLARSYAALGMYAESAAQYDAYIASGRPALPYAYLDRARDQLELGQYAAAIASTRQGLDMGVPADARRTFLLQIAQITERAGPAADAIRAYQTFFDDASTTDADEALALSRIIALKRSISDTSYAADLKQLLSGYPSTSYALQALTDALGRGEPIDPTIRGLVYYRNNDYTKAEPAFQEQIAAAPTSQFSAEAYYYIAAIEESKNDLTNALTNYAAATAVNPQSLIADDALWWRARILSNQGKTADAAPLLQRIVNEFPSSTWAGEAAFARGLLAYTDKRYDDAISAWSATLTSLTDPMERERFTFWQAKAMLAAGNKDGAKPLLDGLATNNEDDYYGIRAVALLKGKQDLPKATRESKVDFAPKLDWPAAEAWLSQRTSRPVSNSAWANDPGWARAEELWLVGRTGQGDTEAFTVMSATGSDPIAMYSMSRALLAEGRQSLSGRAGQRLLRALSVNPNAGLPKELLSLSYPAAFGPIVQKYTSEVKISPLLMLAFVRQESFFDPRAESPAGALGLSQLLPSTGDALATTLKVASYSEDSLLTADTSLRFGAKYMADQLNEFDDEIFVALTAYNAGASAANRWRKASGKDADVFLETIEFSESRSYVELVSENYAVYRFLYGGSSVPDLPDP